MLDLEGQAEIQARAVLREHRDALENENLELRLSIEKANQDLVPWFVEIRLAHQNKVKP